MQGKPDGRRTRLEPALLTHLERLEHFPIRLTIS
jgi:hypothetical protein